MNEEDKQGNRRSARQRTANPLYVEGINQLKKAPKPPRDPPSRQRKKSKTYQPDEDQNSYGIQLQGQRNDYAKQSSIWHSCQLPTSGQKIKVKFTNNPQNTYQSVQIKKQPPSLPKKVDSNCDLLSLFQKVIEDVGKDVPKGEQKERRVVKAKRAQDPQGKIISVSYQNNTIIFQHSKLVQYDVTKVEGDDQQIQDQIVDEMRMKLEQSMTLGSLSIFY